MATDSPNCWDVGVIEETSNFFYEDAPVLLQVRDKQYKVSRSRLCTVSPVFKSMLSLPEQPQGLLAAVELHNEPGDFTAFLWFLHVNPIRFKRYERDCDPLTKFTTAIGIATIAHMYECTEILQWATVEVFAALERRNRKFTVTPTLMSKVHDFASRHPHNAKPGPTVASASPRPTETSLLARTRDVWADLVYISTDPIEWLVAARSLSNQDLLLQAIGYFYILKRGPRDTIDRRLTSKDEQRLLIGAYNLNITKSTLSANVPPAPASVLVPPPQSAFGAPAAPPPPVGFGAPAVPPPPVGFGVAAVPPPPVGFGVAATSPGLFGAARPPPSLFAAVSPPFSGGAWQPRYESEVRKKLDQLWLLFNDSPWKTIGHGEMIGQ